MTNRPQPWHETRPFAPSLPTEEQVRHVGQELVRALEQSRPDWTPVLTRTVQVEVERALLQGLTAAFRTLAEQLPQLIATSSSAESLPADDEKDGYRVLPEADAQPSATLPRSLTVYAPSVEGPSAASETTTDLAAGTDELTTHGDEMGEQPNSQGGVEPSAEYQLARAHCRRARKVSRSGNLGRALAHYTAAIRCAPHYAKAYLARGQLLHRAGHLENAVADLQQAIAINPASSLTHLCLGHTLLALKRWPEAIAACTEAIRLDACKAVSYLHRGLAFARTGQTTPALADADQALRLEPKLVGAYLLRAAICTRQGRNREAIADLTQVLQVEPTNALAYSARGEAHANVGQHGRALADFGRALALQPNLLAAHYHRAVALRHKGEYALSIAAFSQLIENCPDFPRVYYQRALAYLGLDDYDQAIADLDRALERDPGDQEARQRREQALQTRANPPPAKPPREIPEQTAPTCRDKPDATSLSLKCPRCSAPAKISWRRLDKLFKCRQCARMFRVNRDGILSDVDLNQGAPRRRWPSRRLWGAVACVFLGLSMVAWWYWSGGQATGLPELPQDLQARGELLAKGWLGNDRLLLRRLTDPAHDRLLHPWLQRHRPQFLKGMAAAKETPEAQIQVRIRQQRRTQATLVVQVNAPGLARPVELYLNWRKRAETWYFVPSARG